MVPRCGFGEESLCGKTILLHAEQGLATPSNSCGMCRCWPRAARKSFWKILRPYCWICSRLLGDGSWSRAAECASYDFHCPLLSLPLACGTTLETIPAAVSYIVPADADIASWRPRLPQRRPRIGLVWSGSARTTTISTARFSCDPQAVARFARAAFVCLQHEVRDEDLPLLESLASRGEICAIGDQFEDFADTAAAVAQLDAVIAVDTAVAHLVGAMGKPLFLLLPFAADFRWLRERADSPWYPSARLFRQPQFGDWASVVAHRATGIDAAWQPLGQGGLSRPHRIGRQICFANTSSNLTMFCFLTKREPGSLR